ncbi:MAG: FAD-binding protein [Gammaproteobacteria bacterium]
MVTMTSWGRLTHCPHDVIALTERSAVADQLRRDRPGVAYGMGRSYGDICLNPNGVLWTTRGLDRFIAFDENSGRLRCEAGVLIRDIQRLMIPRGWTLPVTPGTQLITVGGAIANDVHGKSHHVYGSFGDHVRRIVLTRTDGSTLKCGPDRQPDWFAATVGGMGLTGIITEADIQLMPTPGPWFDAETVPYDNLDEFFRLSDISGADWHHTVSWIDCITSGGGRGLFMRGNTAAAENLAEPKSRNLTMPWVPPFSLVNGLSLRAFNSLYFNLKKRRAGRERVHYETFLYPLDHIQHWNRMYGPNGFYQYQSVVPPEAGYDAVKAMLKEISAAGDGSFLAVLKTFGKRESIGMMSFPKPGVTLALDFPNQGARTLKLFERLDAVVREAGGRLYPAKDARMPRSLFEAGYPRLNEFIKYRDPGIGSAMSRRLLGT